MPEAGYPDVDMQQWFGLFAPAGIAPAVVQKLNDEFVKALTDDEVKNTLEPQLATIIAGPPEEFAAIIARDLVRMSKVVKESGAKPPQ